MNPTEEWQLEDWAQYEIKKAHKDYKRGLMTLMEFIEIALDVTARASESDYEWDYYISEFYQTYFLHY